MFDSEVEEWALRGSAAELRQHHSSNGVRGRDGGGHDRRGRDRVRGRGHGVHDRFHFETHDHGRGDFRVARRGSENEKRGACQEVVHLAVAEAHFPRRAHAYYAPPQIQAVRSRKKSFDMQSHCHARNARRMTARVPILLLPTVSSPPSPLESPQRRGDPPARIVAAPRNLLHPGLAPGVLHQARDPPVTEVCGEVTRSCRRACYSKATLFDRQGRNVPKDATKEAFSAPVTVRYQDDLADGAGLSFE